MSRILVTVIAAFLLISCSKDKQEFHALPASIQEIIDDGQDCVCLPYVNLYQWNNKEIYLLAYKGPTCNWTAGYFDSDGKPVEMEQGYTLDEFWADGELTRKIWSCDNGEPKRY